MNSIRLPENYEILYANSIRLPENYEAQCWNSLEKTCSLKKRCARFPWVFAQFTKKPVQRYARRRLFSYSFRTSIRPEGLPAPPYGPRLYIAHFYTLNLYFMFFPIRRPSACGKQLPRSCQPQPQHLPCLSLVWYCIVHEN